jgi:hypothetical protein
MKNLVIKIITFLLVTMWFIVVIYRYYNPAVYYKLFAILSGISLLLIVRLFVKIKRYDNEVSTV